VVVDPGATAKEPPLAVVPIGAPPEATVYQLILFPVEIALKLEEPPGQIDEGEATTLLGVAQGELTTVIRICPFPARTAAVVEPAVTPPI
jgi:hypothetical protein